MNGNAGLLALAALLLLGGRKANSGGGGTAGGTAGGAAGRTKTFGGKLGHLIGRGRVVRGGIGSGAAGEADPSLIEQAGDAWEEKYNETAGDVLTPIVGEDAATAILQIQNDLEDDAPAVMIVTDPVGAGIHYADASGAEDEVKGWFS